MILKDKYGVEFKVCSFPRLDIQLYKGLVIGDLFTIESYAWGAWIFFDCKLFTFSIGWFWTVDYDFKIDKKGGKK
jgi:hypothetical protein